jgi:hypothetical protein
MFHLPLEVNMKALWLSWIDQANGFLMILPDENVFLCTMHFAKESFRKTGVNCNRKLLKTYALPSILPSKSDDCEIGDSPLEVEQSIAHCSVCEKECGEEESQHWLADQMGFGQTTIAEFAASNSISLSNHSGDDTARVCGHCFELVSKLDFLAYEWKQTLDSLGVQKTATQVSNY